jgi:hypothetical protein
VIFSGFLVILGKAKKMVIFSGFLVILGKAKNGDFSYF